MGLLDFNVNLQMETQTCEDCGVKFACPSEMLKSRRETGGTFYCPNGHPLSWKKTELQRVQEALAAKQAELSREREAKWAEERARKKVEARLKRVDKGVCPHCNRTFVNVARHMKSKHEDAHPA